MKVKAYGKINSNILDVIRLTSEPSIIYCKSIEQLDCCLAIVDANALDCKVHDSILKKSKNYETQILIVFSSEEQLAQWSKYYINNEKITMLHVDAKYFEIIKTIKSLYSKIYETKGVQIVPEKENVYVSNNISIFESRTKIKFYNINDVLNIHYNRTLGDCELNTIDGKRLISKKHIDHYIEKDFPTYCQVSDIDIVNLSHLKTIHKIDGVFCELPNNIRISVLNGYLKNFLKKIELI